MKYAAIILMASLFWSSEKTFKLDFGAKKSGASWQVINDGVMGGLSEGQAELKENSILFTGNISLQNNGGFSSLKSPFELMDLSAFETVKIRYRSKGMRIAMTMETSRNWFDLYYKQDIPNESDDWQVAVLDLEQFKGYRIGRATGLSLGKAPLQKMLRLGFISNEKRAGTFEMEVDYILFE